MFAIRLRHCLLGSTIIHFALIASITHMSPANHGTRHEIEAFILEVPAAQVQKPPQSLPHGSGSDTQGNVLKKARFQPVHQVARSAPPRAGLKAGLKASPSIAPADLTKVAPEQNKAPAPAAPDTAPISPRPTGSQEGNSGSISSLSSRQSSGSGPVMVLGEAGSPRFIHRELPIYPLIARKFGKEGKVLLRLALDARGQLLGIEIIEGCGFGFAEAASAAMRKSTFAPAVKNGSVISSKVLVPIRFVLHEGH